jgi:DNA-3-methyladenine glycosylase I
MSEKNRCSWCIGSEEYIAYHDHEWGVPVHDDNIHFEFLTLEGAQAGLSWITVLKRRQNYRRLFHDYDLSKIVRMGIKDIDRLLQDPGIIRNRKKVESVIQNAKCFLEVQKEFGSFDNFIWRFTNHKVLTTSLKNLKDAPAQSVESELLSKELRRRGFGFVGPTIMYAYMQACGLVNDHLVSCFRFGQVVEDNKKSQ